MKKELLTGNGAAAWGARLARIDYLPAFPITPQTEIIETIGAWIDQDNMDCRMVTMESEHSMVTAAGAAAATGVRVFTATSSQGLLYATEMIYTVAGWRVPLVLVNVSRGLSSPITLEPDHNDVLAMRDCGFLQLHCATSQEVLDNILLAYRLAEHENIRLPVIVNLDGFYLSFTREGVDIPQQEQADLFLPSFNAGTICFKSGEPLSEGVAVLGGSTYSYFRYESHLASLKAIQVYDELGCEFEKIFGRRYETVENYQSEDAEIVFVMMGSFATKAMDAVNQLRDAGEKIGLVRPRMFRPFPAQALRNALAGKSGIVVIDQNLSMGKGGVLHTELASVLYGQKNAPPIIAGFIGGLGGRDIAPEEFYEMVRVVKQAIKKGESPPPRMLYTEKELREVRKMQTIARVLKTNEVKDD
jgi:pyruvate ferredoxin oxidoreductase alpha subunit